ncbi:hypothetical protein FISHEDRAFT_33972 [Fistulina hepatica ATCC 64428]|uniref:Mediator complex subunit 1 n=1 Tax=Fistulina hepatica ATCC 64428 TaxID=1128425 RepID=A0A0D7AP04_9AGAR|nr:hypothetical protein FISHEDRAFT_33972 [Fistulina hepatica ATCC 64428]
MSDYTQSQEKRSLSSAIYSALEALPTNATHPFDSSSLAETTVAFSYLIETTEQFSQSLSHLALIQFSNSKLVALLRQQEAISRSLNISGYNIRNIVDVLRKRTQLAFGQPNYGQEIPLDPISVVSWTIESLLQWGTVAGMETFKEDRDEGVMLVFAGKVLVIDVDLRVSSGGCKIEVASVKTSIAQATDTANSSNSSSGSTRLNIYFMEQLRRLLQQIQLPAEAQEPRQLAALVRTFKARLAYLAALDDLASQEPKGGQKWVTNIDTLSTSLEAFAVKEAGVLQATLTHGKAPLDIFLLRGHPLPLSHHLWPSLSFLVYCSPLTYFSLLRGASTDATLSDFDIPLSHLRSKIDLYPATIATLRVDHMASSSHTPSVSAISLFSSLSMDMSRPTFALGVSDMDITSTFPQVAADSSRSDWILDFTNEDRSEGVVMAQSRLREIELVVDPLSGMADLNMVGMSGYSSGSWVDLLLNPDLLVVSPERYVSTYKSPTSAHPPLQLHLDSPQEPGYRLKRVPVRNMGEVWAILEIVRGQCWLNATLESCKWTPEGLLTSREAAPEEEPTEEELFAVLMGTNQPTSIPVNVSIPLESDRLYEPSMALASTSPRRPQIRMTCPEQQPIEGLVSIIVALDETRPRGVSVDISTGGMCYLSADTMEEVCRRGGTLGLPGRVWASVRASS